MHSCSSWLHSFALPWKMLPWLQWRKAVWKKAENLWFLSARYFVGCFVFGSSINPNCIAIETICRFLDTCNQPEILINHVFPQGHGTKVVANPCRLFVFCLFWQLSCTYNFICLLIIVVSVQYGPLVPRQTVFLSVLNLFVCSFPQLQIIFSSIAIDLEKVKPTHSLYVPGKYIKGI